MWKAWVTSTTRLIPAWRRMAAEYRALPAVSRLLPRASAPAIPNSRQDIGHHGGLGIFRPQRPTAADQHRQLRVAGQLGAPAQADQVRSVAVSPPNSATGRSGRCRG
jgi:hypothetical protein